MAPQNISFSFLVPVNVTLFGKKFFADMIKCLEIEKYPGEINIFLHKRGRGRSGTQKRRWYEDCAERDWKYWP